MQPGLFTPDEPTPTRAPVVDDDGHDGCPCRDATSAPPMTDYEVIDGLVVRKTPEGRP
jgi:hypothetical protein